MAALLSCLQDSDGAGMITMVIAVSMFVTVGRRRAAGQPGGSRSQEERTLRARAGVRAKEGAISRHRVRLDLCGFFHSVYARGGPDVLCSMLGGRTPFPIIDEECIVQ